MSLPVRGPGVRELDLALPPARLALLRGGRLRKRWRYVGFYTAELMLCTVEAQIGPIPQRWTAVALPDGSLHEGRDAVVRLELDEDPSAVIEVASPAGGDHYIWTRKQAGVPARGSARVAGEEHRLEGVAFVDESAGYHPRHTVWSWSAGNGRARDGRAVAWNLVTG